MEQQKIHHAAAKAMHAGEAEKTLQAGKKIKKKDVLGGGGIDHPPEVKENFKVSSGEKAEEGRGGGVKILWGERFEVRRG